MRWEAYEDLKLRCAADPAYQAAKRRFAAAPHGSQEEAEAYREMSKAASKIEFPNLGKRVRERAIQDEMRRRDNG